MTLSQDALQSPAQKLAPISPLFILFHTVGKLLLPALLGVFGTSGRAEDAVVVVFGSVVALATLFQYRFYRYWLEADRLVVKQGILFKSLRQIPYTRIQNLNVVKNPLHKFFKVATLQVESASGSKPEAVIRVMGLEQVENLRARVQQARDDGGDALPTADADATPAANDFSLSDAEVAKYGFISHRALVPVGVIFSIVMNNDTWRSALSNRINALLSTLDVAHFSLLQWLIYGAVMLLGALLAIWAVSIAMAFLQLRGFTLRRLAQKIHVDMGLLTTHSATVPLHRIQLIRFNASPLHRWLKRTTVTMETAGAVAHNQGFTMHWIAPLAEPQAAQALVRKLLPEIDLATTAWQPVQWRGWRRLAKRNGVILAILTALSGPFIGHWAWLAMPLAALILWHARAFVRGAAHACSADYIAYRSGVLFRHISVVRLNKVQTVSLHSSPFDRRHRMARLSVDTAGSQLNKHRVHIPYLDAKDAQQMHQWIAEHVRHMRFVW